MENIVLMLKDKESGYLTSELAIIPVNDGASLISCAYVTEEDDGLYVHMTLTCGTDVSDEDFEYIFDEYGDGFDSELVIEIYEAEEYNPAWEMVFPYDDKRDVIEASISQILTAHMAELERIMKRGC